MKHFLVAVLLPCGLVLPAAVVNECAYSALAPYYANLTSNSSMNGTSQQLNVSQEDVLGTAFAKINPGFCLGPDANKAWFTTRVSYSHNEVAS